MAPKLFRVNPGESGRSKFSYGVSKQGKSKGEEEEEEEEEEEAEAAVFWWSFVRIEKAWPRKETLMIVV
jgi:hypothetical protein